MPTCTSYPSTAAVGGWSVRSSAKAGIWLMTRIRGSSNAKARRALDWQLRHPSRREGFRTGLT